MFVHVLEPDGCITSCCCCCCCCVMSATADAKFQLLLLLLFLSLCIPFACTFSTCDSRLGWWWCCCCCCCCFGWLTDWLPATLCSLLPTQKALAIITSTQFYFISWMQSQSQPHLPPLLPPFVYLVFVSFLHAHKIKCNNSKRCNNSVRYLSRFLFYCSLCLALPLCSFFVCLFNFSAILLAARALTLHLHFRVAARPLKICCIYCCCCT